MTTTQALGWALVHSLWQCALAPAGLASLLSILPSRAARVRYAFATATLVLMVAVPLGTALSLHEASPWHGALAAVLTPAPTLAGPARRGVRRAGPGPPAPPAPPPPNGPRGGRGGAARFPRLVLAGGAAPRL